MTEPMKTDNELIDEFMGAKPIEDIPYDKDWNLLMPVVERIEKKYVVTIKKNTCFISVPDAHLTECRCDKKIDNVFYAVVEFIKWYNQQNL